MKIEIINNDCLVALKTLTDNSVDSVVTDPPHGISFMGKKWDYDVPSVDVWKEVFRVLKPGGHILCACGTRTQHRMTVNIEDAGFEIRDVVAWIYGSGFPKSLNIAKAIDGTTESIGHGKRETLNAMGDGLNNRCNICGKPFFSGNPCQCDRSYKAKSGESEQWSGWGTALKPAMELWTLARKPLSEKTVAQNVLKYGTGGINVDGCRVGHDEEPKFTQRNDRENASVLSDESCGFDNTKNNIASASPQGRFPANVIHDGSDEVVNLFPNTKKGSISDYNFEKINQDNPSRNVTNIKSGVHFGDEGSASRFFYCAKASKSERNKGCDKFEDKKSGVKNDLGRGFSESDPYKEVLNKNNHPTVKPISLMRYLCRMITPKNGTILDPYMGSGSTGIGAKVEGFNFIGIEREADYCKIAQARIDAWEEEKPDTQGSLF